MNSPNRPLIPKGVAILLPEAAARRRAIERTSLALFERRGYQEIITPTFEYLDVFQLGVADAHLDHAYKFVDRATGRMMILRPDVTPQIARTAATLLRDRPRPLRLCYSANVFRHAEEHAGQEREIFQIGAESIGAPGIDADVEAIDLMIDLLRTLGLSSFKIAIGQMAFTRGVLAPFEAMPESFEKILHAVAKKEAAALEAALHLPGIDTTLRQAVLSLPHLYGGPEALKAAEAFAAQPACRAGLSRLSTVYEKLVERGHGSHLVIDLGEVRGFDYYTGVVFEIFAEGVGSALGGGGRYDGLLEKFGHPAPAIGFAVDVERLQAALDYARSPARLG